MTRRLLACWRLKLALAVALSLLLCGPYFWIGHHPLRPVRTLPLSWVDRAIGFHPGGWTWVYQSDYLAVDLIPLLATTRRQLRRYAAGFAAVAAVSFGVFVLWPIRGPQPGVIDPVGLYGLLQRYDVWLNSCPSLHVSLLVYTLAFGRRVVAVRPWVTVAVAAWGVAIAYSTVATKEHYAVDVAAGAALGWAADAWAWRAASRSRLSSSGRTSHAGRR